MASPMRMRGGGAVEIGCAVIAAAGADAGAAFASRAVDDDNAAVDADDFAVRAEDGDVAMVVPSPKASVSASLIAAGDASFERLRLLERVLFVRVAGAEAFRFFGMGVYVVAAGRRPEIAAGARCC
jgi:hypothetical protein